MIQLKVHRCLPLGEVPENSLSAIGECPSARVTGPEIDIAMLRGVDFLVNHVRRSSHAAYPEPPTKRVHSIVMTSVELNAPPLEFIDISGYRMAFRQWGNTSHSDAIFLIHGITSSSLSWIRVAPRLAQHARVVAVDLKGHGDSDQPAAGYRLATQADEVAAVVSTLGLHSIRLMGHSWGGAISALLGGRTDVPITRVVLEDPAIAVGGTPDRRKETIQNYVGSVGLDRVETERRVRNTAAPGWTEDDIQGKIDAAVKANPASVRAVFDENGAWDVTAELIAIEVPTLLVRAEVSNGGIVGDALLHAIRANSLIEVVTIPGADHNIHRGKFDAFMRCVEAFIVDA
jgi:N-formylmaleamate deformylase